MAVEQGFTEVYNYSFVTEEMVRAFDLDVAAHVGVTIPSRPIKRCCGRACCPLFAETFSTTAATSRPSGCLRSA